MLFSSRNEKRGDKKTRTRKGAVVVMVLLIVVAMATLFQAYMTHVLNDMKAGSTFDTRAQLNGERMAIGHIVKEAVLQYYERPRVGQSVTSIDALTKEYLDQMAATGVTYTVTLNDTFPVNGSTFWPAIPNSAAIGTSTAMGTFDLYSEKVPADLSKSRIAQYVGDSSASILGVRKSTKNDVFSVTVKRTEGGSSINFVYYLRMYQVPVTNYNVIAYAITDKGDDIPNSPPTLGAATTVGDISVLALSKMDAGNSINKGAAAQSTAYPYLYRELFSSAASVWEYVFYNNASNVNYMATDVMKDANDVYMLSDPYLSDVTKTVTTGGVTSAVTCSLQDGSTGFDPEYKSNGTTVDAEGYRVTAAGGYVDASGNIVGLLNSDGTVATTDINADGIINHQDVTKFGNPDELDWTFDLQKIATINSADSYRQIYVHLPDTIPSTITKAQITITDSVSGAVTGYDKPVIICVEGWSRANNEMKSVAHPDNYKIYLDGPNLKDQQIMLYVAGVDVLLGSNCSMDGMLFFDDKLAGFNRNNHSFTFRGLAAWNGNMTAPNIPVSGIGMDSNYITITPLPAGTDNQFRSIAPRYLLVDVRSESN